MLHKKVSALMVLVILGMLIAPATAASQGDNEVHVTKMIVQPNGPDMHFTIYYDTDFFTKVFSIIFGAKIIEPSIERVFTNFSNVTLVSIDTNNEIAGIVVKNQSTLDNTGWYVYNQTTTFAYNIDVIEIHNSDGSVITLTDTNTLPVISNRMPMLTTP